MTNSSYKNWGIVIILFSFILLLSTISVLVLQFDARNQRVVATKQREETLAINKLLEKQNVYKVCMIDLIFKYQPEERTPEMQQSCIDKSGYKSE